MVYLSEGIPAIQLGQEFLRTKGGNGDSYNAGDEVNAIDWDRTTQYSGSVDYVRGLIKLRNRIAALRQTSYNDINASVTMLKSANGVVAYQAKDSSGTYVVIFNANNDAAAIDASRPASTRCSPQTAPCTAMTTSRASPSARLRIHRWRTVRHRAQGRLRRRRRSRD